MTSVLRDRMERMATPGFAERFFNAIRTETPLEAYYRRIEAIRKGSTAIWHEIDRLSDYERAQYLFFKRWGDKTFEQIMGRM